MVKMFDGLLVETKKILRCPSDGQPAKVLRCNICKGEELKAASGDYLTVIACVKCKKPVNVHEG